MTELVNRFLPDSYLIPQEESLSDEMHRTSTEEPEISVGFEKPKDIRPELSFDQFQRLQNEVTDRIQKYALNHNSIFPLQIELEEIFHEVVRDIANVDYGGRMRIKGVQTPNGNGNLKLKDLILFTREDQIVVINQHGTIAVYQNKADFQRELALDAAKSDNPLIKDYAGLPEYEERELNTNREAHQEKLASENKVADDIAIRIDWKRGYTDSLTGLYNRAVFMSNLELMVLEQKKGFMIMFDGDYFKCMNELQGTVFGDDMIRVMADELRLFAYILADRGIKADVGRFGGEEFGILIEACDQEIVSAELEKVKKRISERIQCIMGKHKNVFVEMLRAKKELVPHDGINFVGTSTMFAEEFDFANADPNTDPKEVVSETLASVNRGLEKTKEADMRNFIAWSDHLFRPRTKFRRHNPDPCQKETFCNGRERSKIRRLNPGRRGTNNALTHELETSEDLSPQQRKKYVQIFRENVARLVELVEVDKNARMQNKLPWLSHLYDHLRKLVDSGHIAQKQGYLLQNFIEGPCQDFKKLSFLPRKVFMPGFDFLVKRAFTEFFNYRSQHEPTLEVLNEETFNERCQEEKFRNGATIVISGNQFKMRNERDGHDMADKRLDANVGIVYLVTTKFGEVPVMKHLSSLVIRLPEYKEVQGGGKKTRKYLTCDDVHVIRSALVRKYEVQYRFIRARARENTPLDIAEGDAQWLGENRTTSEINDEPEHTATATIKWPQAT